MQLLRKTIKPFDMSAHFAEFQIEAAEVMEVWETEARDDGNFVEYRLMRKGCTLYTKRVDKL